MKENEGIAEVALAVKVPRELKETMEGLCYLEFKGDKVRLYRTADIAREALLKGLRLMLLEKEVFERMIHDEAKKGATRIYGSLVKENSGKRGEEKKNDRQ